MRLAKTSGVIVCGLILGLVNIATAADGDTYGSVSSFSTDKLTKAKNSPQIGATFPIPADLEEGDELQIDCVYEAFKNHKGTPRPGVKGNLALFAIALDVGSGTWEFSGLLNSGIPFKTKRDGTVEITSGLVIAGAWATDSHPTNDFISAKVGLTNKKKLRESTISCVIVVGG